MHAPRHDKKNQWQLRNRNVSFSLRHIAALLLLTLSLFAGLPVTAQIQFEDVSVDAGIVGQGETWGASWGDYNGDRWPDIFVNGHRGVPRFYRNNADGTFTDVALALDPGVWLNNPTNDQHAAGFADFDNDGDQDIYINVSASGPAQLLVNDGGTFSEAASSADLQDDGAARGPVWFDWTNDGYLDVAILGRNGIRMRRQDPAQGLDFDVDDGTGIDCPNRTDYGQLIDLDDDGSLEFICHNQGAFPAGAQDTSSRPFIDVASSIPSASNVIDTVTADFDGDRRSDIFMVRGAIRPTGATLVNPNRIEAWLVGPGSGSGGERGFRFASAGAITVTIDYNGLGPAASPDVLVLNPSGPSSGSAGAVDVFYRSSSSDWEVSIASGNNRAYVIVETVTPIANLTMFGLSNPDLPISSRLMVNPVGGAQFDFAAGLNDPVSCVSAVAGDFDNDMDQDLYLACRQGVENLPNRLYENQGNGTFVWVNNSGAQGPVGAGLSSKVGVAESVTVADYDADGFLDLFVLNGLLMRPWGVGGNDTLLRNLGNGNHWVQFDLEGTASNRDGIGAKVYVTAGGTTQLREQNGGYHRWSQNERRLHFGLATNQTFDVTIQWPSGEVDTFTSVLADKIYRATEAGQLVESALGPPIDTGLAPGDECGTPAIDAANIQGVWVWKNCTTNQWFLRVSAGGSPTTVKFEGNLFADVNFTAVSGFSTEASDFIDTTEPAAIGFSLGVKNSGVDGVDFSLPTSATACLTLDLPLNTPLYVGGSAKSGLLPLNLSTLGQCASIVSVADLNVDEAAGVAAVTVSLSATVFSQVTVSYATSNGTATAGSDYTATNGQVVIGAGDTSASFNVPLLNDSTEEGEETFTVTLNNPVNALLGQATATVTILDDDAGGGVCGEPVYDNASEAVMLVWRDCDTGGPDQLWHVRVTGGGSANTLTFGGTVTATDILSATPFSLEGNDVLDSVPGDANLDYLLKVKGSGQDGFALSLPATAQGCFAVDTLPAGVPVQVGASRQGVSVPFHMETLEPCSTSGSTLSINDASVNESTGTVTLTVSLTPASAEVVSVDYDTQNGSAVVGSDFSAANGTLVFAQGETSKPITIAIVEDAVPENDESFNVTLNNAANALIADGVGTITIQNDDGSLVLFSDDFEASSGWVNDPNGTDNGTTGQWEIGAPQATSSSGVSLQLGNANSGANALITGLTAGSSVGSFDIDNGVVSIRSPGVVLPSSGNVSVQLSYYFAHLDNATNADFLRVTMQGTSTSRVLLEELGSPNGRAGLWTSFSDDVSDFAGQSISILIEAADNSGGSLIEAGIDDVIIEQQ